MTDDGSEGRKQQADSNIVNPKSKIQNPKSNNPQSAIRNPQSEDPFDRLYLEWAKDAIKKRLDPPSRERWDAIVLRLILSEDPDRIKRYRWLESTFPESLGADAHELWRKTPDYTPNLSVPLKTIAALEEYAQAHQGSMRRLMESQGFGDGFGDRYNALLADYEQYLADRKARIKHGQTQVLIIGCAGMGFILVMILSVFLIIFLRLN